MGIHRPFTVNHLVTIHGNDDTVTGDFNFHFVPFVRIQGILSRLEHIPASVHMTQNDTIFAGIEANIIVLTTIVAGAFRCASENQARITMIF